jgi:hypothetical protein
VAAARESEVFTGDADPLVVLRGGEHRFDQLAILGLNPISLDQRFAGLGDANGQPVPDGLQLTEVEYTRRGGRRLESVGDLGVTEGLAEESGQLRLKARDLPAQLQPSLALVNRDAQPGQFLESQQNRHLRNCSQAASRVEAAIHKASSTAI